MSYVWSKITLLLCSFPSAHFTIVDKRANIMSLGFVMILFAAVYESSANMSHQDGSNYFSSLYMYPKPATLPILPYYEVEIPEQEGKFFGGAAATRYETVSVLVYTLYYTSKMQNNFSSNVL